MKVELTRFRVKRGKSSRVDEWLNMLNANRDEVLQTLERKQMKLEVIFREIVDGEEYLYWLSVQGEAGEPVTTSPSPLIRSTSRSTKNVSIPITGCAIPSPR